MIYNQEKTYSGIEISGGIGEGGQQRDGIGGGGSSTITATQQH